MEEIEIINEKPPICDRLHKRFGVKWDEGIIIAFDSKIYCKKEVDAQKIVHEKIHLDEQKRLGNDAWWELYLTNDVFRLEQETMAYRAEANFIKKHVKNREHAAVFYRDIAKSFSSGVYGNIISQSEALRLIWPK
jgi:hypothetical protein